MAYAAHYTTKLEPGQHYHIYNRGVAKELLFITPENNRFFLSKIELYICPAADILAYSLNRNHFHLTIRTHETSSVKESSDAFRRLFQSYAMAFNKQQRRHGTLFQEPFKRALVDSDEYLMRLIRYLHLNPEKHKLVRDFRIWPHTSYHALTGTGVTFLNRDYVLGLFGGLEGFMQYHERADEPLVGRSTLED